MGIIKAIFLILFVLLVLSVFQCERSGGVSNIISEIIVDTRELVDNVKDKVREKEGK